MRRRYRDPSGYGYPPPGGYGYRRGYGGGSSCLRDACLIESGCCIAEALDGNCLMTSMLLVPQLMTASVAGARTGGGSGGIVAAIRFYQREISARRRPVCRFTPSCSEYTAQAVTEHGTWRGLRLGLRRLIRCRPGGARGADPVPATAVG